jgi:quinohemoprotein amine dehydrogenase
MRRPAHPAALLAASLAAVALSALVAACLHEPKKPAHAQQAPAPVAGQKPVAAPTPVAAPKPVAAPGQVAAPVPVAAPAQGEPGAASGEHAQREGRRGEGEGDEKKDEDKKDEKRKGIRVTSALVIKYCSTCHQDQGDGALSRISFMRKTPEGWELSLKRMIRLQHMVITPEDARAIVRYLANDHGLARAEAEKSMYEVERRIHWSEEQADKDLRASCGECHTLGRVLAERRDDKEWKLLKATHLAMFPLARWQAFRGEGDQGDRIDWESMTEAEAQDAWEARQRAQGPDQADKVLGKLAKDLPLFTPEWEQWRVNRREVPIAGSWDVLGHEPSRGDVRGTVTITAAGPDAYDTKWEIAYGPSGNMGAPLVRTGKGLLYAGYSWRGRSETKAPGEAPELREVLLLSDDWNTLAGRIFTGEYNETGADVTLRRRTGATEVLAAVDPAVMVPSKGATLELDGRGFPDDLKATDFNLGEGVTVTAAKRTSADRARLTLDVARSARRGSRVVSFRAVKGPAEAVLYDTVDYLTVNPDQGLARVGGKMRPPQVERFEAIAMNRGPDDELYTPDDFAVKVVPARWSLEEFPVRENDDDAKFVGRLDAATGAFTPALDGPNPARKWTANNIGEVFVVATCKLTVQDVGPPKKPEPPKPPGVPAPGTPPPPVEEEKPVVMVEREFRARGHLLVMVPIYVQWDRYVWDQR